MDFKIWLIYIFSYFGLYASIMLLLSFYEERKRLENPDPYYPEVSVIVPAYNEEDTIAKTIESLLDLDYPKEKLDLMVVDDGSTDSTLEIAKRYEKDGVRVFHQSNNGKASALNNGLSKARGEFVAGLDADSFVMPDVLTKMMGHFRNEKVMAVAPSIKIWKPSGFLERVQQVEFLSATIIRKIFTMLGGLNLIPGPLGMFRKSFLDETGGWDEDTITEDLELSFRIEDKKEYLIESSLDASVYTKAASSFKEAYSQRLRWFKGYISNLWNYRHMFSPEYGNMGLFIMPVSILSVALAAVLFIYSIIKGSINFVKNIYDLYLIGFDITTWFQFNPDPFFVNTSGAMLLPLFLAVLSTLLIYIARKFDESEDSIKLSYVYFIATYWFFSSVCWLSAFYHKFSGKHVVWKEGKK